MLAQTFYSHEDMLELFYLPLSMQTFQALEELQLLMQHNPLTEQEDVWSYCWGSELHPCSVLCAYS
jgi:hypothetical protein